MNMIIVPHLISPLRFLSKLPLATSVTTHTYTHVCAYVCITVWPTFQCICKRSHMYFIYLLNFLNSVQFFLHALLNK